MADLVISDRKMYELLKADRRYIWSVEKREAFREAQAEGTETALSDFYEKWCNYGT